MSGHSHFKTIKHKKGIADAKRSKAFSKMAKLISVAAKEGGGDPEMNPGLRMAIEKAKSVNLPKENVERAIKRGTGELEGVQLEQIALEAFGPGGIALIVETVTDNKKRTLSHIRQILNQHNGKLADSGSVKWLFERKGAINIDFEVQPEQQKNKGALELSAIEAGAEDLFWDQNNLEIYTKIQDLEKVKQKLEQKQIVVDSSSLTWQAKQSISIGQKQKQACQKLFEALDQHDDVQDIYSNLKEQ